MHNKNIVIHCKSLKKVTLDKETDNFIALQLSV